MRPKTLAVLAVGFVAVGAVAVFAGVRTGIVCFPGSESKSGHAAHATHATQGKISGNFDSAMSGVCRFACATKLEYEAADVVPQPGAVDGKLAQCPVSGVVFSVDSDRPKVSVEGERYVTCCGNCAGRLEKNPKNYLKV